MGIKISKSGVFPSKNGPSVTQNAVWVILKKALQRYLIVNSLHTIFFFSLGLSGSYDFYLYYKLNTYFIQSALWEKMVLFDAQLRY